MKTPDKDRIKHPNNLRKLRKAVRLTQDDIARIWGVHRGDVSRIERGEHSITTVKRELLTKHFGWTASQLLDQSEASFLPVSGLVVDAGTVVATEGRAAGAGKLRDSASAQASAEQVVLPLAEYTMDLACLRVDGHSMHPVYKHNDVLFYRTTPCPLEQCYHRDCVVTLKDGRVMVRTVKAGRSYGHINLDSYQQPPMEDVEIQSAAPIEWVKKSVPEVS